jgi:hypothetical protein
MRKDRQGGKVSLMGRFSAWLRSLSGIISSIAAIATAAAALFAAYQTTRVHEQSRTIAQQSHQLQQIQARPVPTVTVTVTASAGSSQDGGTGGALLTQKGFLSALQPTVGNPQSGPQTMSSDAYQNSVTFGCSGTGGNDQPDVAWDIAGSHKFTTTVGIPDNTPNVTGVAETVIFANQNGADLGKPVVVSLGSPAKVTLDVTGVTQLAATCTGVDIHTHQPNNDNPVTLGNAGVS